MIVIQARPLVDSSVQLWPPLQTVELSFRLDREYLYDLEHIQTLLSFIEFGKTNWAYMFSNSKGAHQIVQRQRSLYKISTPTWVPRIEEQEITYVKWILVDMRMGRWKEKDVDVILGYEDHYLQRVEATMNGYRRLEGLDITYAVLAHVISGDGSVIGVVTEPEVGRLVQAQDRSLVYDAITRLQRRNLIYCGIHWSKIHILDGKVRLSNLASIFYIEDLGELEKKAEKRHWQALEALFASLDPNDEEPKQAPERALKPIAYQLLPGCPAPERPRFIRFLLTTYLPQGFPNKKRFSKSERTNARSCQRSVVAPSVESVSAEGLEVDREDVTDLPLSIHRQNNRQHSRRESKLLLPGQPYWHCHRRKGPLLLNSSNGDSDDSVL